MTRFYSRTTGTTYLDGYHAQIPGDAVEISEERFLAVIANPTPGKIRSHDTDGLPILIDPPQPSLVDQADALFTAQVDAINRSCEAAITAGFSSSALGSPHVYSSQLDDQLNLTGAILRAEEMPYACRDEQGVKAYRVHTAVQLRQAGNDFTLYKLQLLQRANELKRLLELARQSADLEGMQQITWETDLR